MHLLLLIFAAPIVQITLSILRLLGKLQLPLYAIFVLALAIGVAASFAAMSIVFNETPALSEGIRCGTPAMAFFFGGLFIAFITGPLIWIVCALINVHQIKRAAKI